MVALALPRMPSVPKYLRTMAYPVPPPVSLRMRRETILERFGPENLKKLRGRLRHPLPCHRPARAGDSVTSKGACATARIIEVSGYWVARIVRGGGRPSRAALRAATFRMTAALEGRGP